MAPGAPGPFALDDPDRIRRALDAAGWAEIAIEPVDEPQNVGGSRTRDEAVSFLLVAGPAAARSVRQRARRNRPRCRVDRDGASVGNGMMLAEAILVDSRTERDFRRRFEEIGGG